MAKKDESVARPRNDAYTGLLAISFLALVGGSVFLYLYAQEMGDPPKDGVKVDVVSGPIGTAGTPLSRITPPYALKDPPEPPKKDPMPMEPPKDPMMMMPTSKLPQNPEVLPAVLLGDKPEVKPVSGNLDLPPIPEIKRADHTAPSTNTNPVDVPPLPVTPFAIPK